MQIKTIKRASFKGPIFNIGVKNDESYTVHGIKVKNCRGIWVEILNDEEDKPAITGIPNSIRDKVGDSVNEITQPKSPIVKKNSAARKKIDDGKAGQ